MDGFSREEMQIAATALSKQGVYLGTSSWKYEGWLGAFYSPSRYEYRGKVARSRFERDCLAEYAEVFKTVCVDAAYYDFPRPAYLDGLAAQTPDDFQFGFKVTDAITIRKFPNLDRFGARAGQVNPDFLNATLFSESFLKPLERIRPKVGVLMFEFSRFWPSDYARGSAFVADLDRFLSQLPPGWPYAIEMRNRTWLAPEYFDCLKRHHVAHVFNSWEAMPPVSEQWALPGSRPHPSLVAARFLLKPGRKYEDAVKQFSPYDGVKEVQNDARLAGAEIIREALCEKGRKTYVYVNNRLEGNALVTLAAMIAQAIQLGVSLKPSPA